MIKTLKDVEVTGKRVLFRAPFDISPKKVDGKLVPSDDTRIQAVVPTIEYLLNQGCSIVFLTWVKRPEGKVVEDLRTAPIAKRLGEILGKPVKTVQACIGPDVDKAKAALKPGDMLMLENVRFYPEEKKDNDDFARELVKDIDVVVYDAFPQTHRRHSSTTGVVRHGKEVCIGLQLEKEIQALSKVTENPTHPFVAVFGGAKITDKVGVLKNFVSLADSILIGGALANTFLVAKGMEVGTSLVDVESVNVGEEEMSSVDVAKELLTHQNIVLPLDLVAGSDPDSAGVVVDLATGTIPDGHAYYDIGPKTIEKYTQIIAGAKTIFFNGPMGFFEKPEYAKGTKAVATAIANSSGVTVLGGGDTASVVEDYKLQGKFDHVSIGGGASLEFVSGEKLPVIEEFEKRGA